MSWEDKYPNLGGWGVFGGAPKTRTWSKIQRGVPYAKGLGKFALKGGLLGAVLPGEGVENLVGGYAALGAWYLSRRSLQTKHPIALAAAAGAYGLVQGISSFFEQESDSTRREVERRYDSETARQQTKDNLSYYLQSFADSTTPWTGLQFSGEDDVYNIIEGLRHEGMATETRRSLTEFGSGWTPWLIGGAVVGGAIAAFGRKYGTDIAKWVGGEDVESGGQQHRRKQRKEKEERSKRWWRRYSPFGRQGENISALSVNAIAASAGTTRVPGALGGVGGAYRLYGDESPREISGAKVGTRISGRDDTYNTITGLRHGGFASSVRENVTDFGSGWNVLKSLLRRGEKLESMVARKGFQKALGKAKHVKELGYGATGTVSLMETTYRGKAIQFARKQGMITEDEIAALRAGQGTITPTVYASKPGMLDMEYFPGRTLKESDLMLSSDLKKKVANAYADIHGRGFLQGDPNLGNVMLVDTPSGMKEVGLIDFGAAKRLSSFESAATARQAANYELSVATGAAEAKFTTRINEPLKFKHAEEEDMFDVAIQSAAESASQESSRQISEQLSQISKVGELLRKSSHHVNKVPFEQAHRAGKRHTVSASRK